MEKGGLIIGTGHVLGVSIEAAANGSEQVRYVHLHRRKGHVHLIAQGSAEDPEALIAARGTRIPIALAIHTSRCLHRVVEREGSEEELWHAAFPGLDAGTMLVSRWKTGTSTGISAMRRSDGLRTLDTLRGKGCRVVDLHIGPWRLLALGELLGSEEDDLLLPGHAFRIQDAALKGYAPAALEPGSQLTIGSDVVPGAHALAFATAWCHLVPPVEASGTDAEPVNEARMEERARIWYEHGLALACVVLLLLFAGERMLHQWSHSQEQGLRTSLSEQERMAAQVNETRNALTRYKGLAALTGMNGTHDLAEQAANLAATVPSGITLDRLRVFPLTSALKEKQLPAVQPGRIHIAGTCGEAVVLNRWVQDLGTLPTTKAVRLLSYALGERDGAPHFEIEIET